MHVTLSLLGVGGRSTPRSTCYAAAVSDPAGRVVLAVAAALGLGFALLRLAASGIGRRDLVMTGYAAVVAVLGVYAVLGAEAAVLAGSIILGAFLLGLAIYALLALAGRWALRG